MTTPNEIILAGFRFEVASYTTDAHGNSIAIPGKCLGKATKARANQPSQPAPQPNTQPSTPSGPNIASAHSLNTASTPITVPARRLSSTGSPASTASPAPARPRKARSQSTARRTPAQRWQQRHQQQQRWQPRYNRYQKPPPLIVKTEPMSAGAVWGWVIAIALAIGAIWLMNAGNEEAKWRSVEATAKAIRGR